MQGFEIRIFGQNMYYLGKLLSNLLPYFGLIDRSLSTFDKV